LEIRKALNIMSKMSTLDVNYPAYPEYFLKRGQG
jgi:hypothetical protein